MKLVLPIIVLFCIIEAEAQFAGFEHTLNCGDRTSIEAIHTWGNGALISKRCWDSQGDGRFLEKVDADGNVEWTFGAGGDSWMYLDDYHFGMDSSIWVLGIDYGCDYLGTQYTITRHSQFGELEYEFQGEFEWGSPPDFGWTGNNISVLNDTLLTISSSSEVYFFSTSSNSLFEEINLPNFPSPIEEIINPQMGVGLLLYDENVVVFGENGAILEQWTLDEFPLDIAMWDDQIIVTFSHSIHSYDIEGGLNASFELNENIFLKSANPSQSGLVAMAIEGANHTFYYLDTELNLLNQWDVPDAEVFNIRDAAILENQEIIMAGDNGHHTTSLGVLKSFSIDGATTTYDHDIEIIEVTMGDIHAAVESLYDPTVLWISALDVEVTIRNNSDLPVGRLVMHSEIEQAPGFCASPYIQSWLSTELINSGETTLVLLPYVGGYYLMDPEEGEMFLFETCFWTHGPDDKMDDVPENDYFCFSEEWIYTSVSEFKSTEFTILRSTGQDLLRIQSSASVDWMLLDMSGRVLLSGSEIGNQTINTSFLPAGIYICAASTSTHTETLKFFVD